MTFTSNGCSSPGRSIALRCLQWRCAFQPGQLHPQCFFFLCWEIVYTRLDVSLWIVKRNCHWSVSGKARLFAICNWGNITLILSCWICATLKGGAPPVDFRRLPSFFSFSLAGLWSFPWVFALLFLLFAFVPFQWRSRLCLRPLPLAARHILIFA